MSTALTRDEAVVVAQASLHAVMGGTLADLEAVIHPEATNREAAAEPPATRGRGAEAFYATGEWLRDAFSELTWTTEQNVTEEDLVVTYGTMSGRHTGNFVVWTPDATVERVFVPTGLPFSVRQAHFQRIRDGLVIEHWAVRDDQGMALQAGWIPPNTGLPRFAALWLPARPGAPTRGHFHESTRQGHDFSVFAGYPYLPRSQGLLSAEAARLRVGLTGCGGSDSKETPDAVEDAASVVPSDLESAVSGDADLDGEADAGAALTADQFCGFITEETPKVIDVQPAEYAAATFGTAVFAFYSDNGLMTDIDGADMDAPAAEGCPDAAAKLLPALGASSFEAVLSQ